jgi:hypothetical protein
MLNLYVYAWNDGVDSVRIGPVDRVELMQGACVSVYLQADPANPHIYYLEGGSLEVDGRQYRNVTICNIGDSLA